MCGRYQFGGDEGGELARIAREIERACGPGAWTPGEIRPSALAPVLLPSGAGSRAALLRWGFPTERSLIINARAETAAEKPLFRGSVAAGRCLIPAAGFYEWDADKRKYLFTLPGGAPLYMAGLTAVIGGEPRACILTTAANASVRETHGRMPLILTAAQRGPWLHEPSAAPELLRAVPPMLERSSAEPQLSLW